MDPDQEMNWQLFSAGGDAHPTEPLRPGPSFLFFVFLSLKVLLGHRLLIHTSLREDLVPGLGRGGQELVERLPVG